MFLIGVIVVIASVAGGFVLAKGQLLALWQPTELIIIIGSAIGAFIISEPGFVIKRSIVLSCKLMIPDSTTKETYIKMLQLLYKIGIFIQKNGLLSIENEINDPANSKLLQGYSSIISNYYLSKFLLDNLRILIGGNVPFHDFDELMEHDIEVIAHELQRPANAINHLGESFPGFGIIAAVLGIVITMQFIGGDPAILGIKVAAALVGTFLGVLLAYGFVGPMATSIKGRIDNELKLYKCIRVFLLSFSNGINPVLAIEFARRSIAPHLRPDYLEVEKNIRKLRL